MEINNLMSEMFRDIPLDVRIQVDNEAMLIDLFVELGLKKDNTPWTTEDDAAGELLLKYSSKHTKTIMETIDNHKKDQNI